MKQTSIEAKRNNRFSIEFPEEFDIKFWTVAKLNMPRYTDHKWEDIKIHFIDPIDPSTSQGLYRIVDFLHKNNNKKSFEIKIKMLDPIGTVIETWIVSVEKVLTINFGELDYSDDSIHMPFIIVKPLYCALN